MKCSLFKVSARCAVLGVGLSILALAATLPYLQPPAPANAVVPLRAEGELDGQSGKDCGPAALYVICNLDGRPRSLQLLRDLSEASSSGTTMLNLKRAALRLGFRVDARRGSFGSLQRHVRGRGCYAIIHTLGRRGGHFVAVVGAPDAQTIRVADVARGVADLRRDAFQAEYGWQGHMLLLSRRGASGGVQR